MAKFEVNKGLGASVIQRTYEADYYSVADGYVTFFRSGTSSDKKVGSLAVDRVFVIDELPASAE